MNRDIVPRTETLTEESPYELLDNLKEIHIVYSGDDAAIRIRGHGVKLPYVSVETTSRKHTVKGIHLQGADRAYLDSPHVVRAVWGAKPNVRPGATKVPHCGVGIDIQSCQGATLTNHYAFGYGIGVTATFGLRTGTEDGWPTSGLTMVGGRSYYNSLAGFMAGRATEKHTWKYKGRPVEAWENDGLRELWIQGGIYEGNGFTQMWLAGSRVAGCLTGVHLEPSVDNAGTMQPALWIGHHHPYKNDILDLIGVRAGYVKAIGRADGVLIRKSTIIRNVDADGATAKPWIEE